MKIILKEQSLKVASLPVKQINDDIKKSWNKSVVLKLKGKTLVLVDWANIYGWRHWEGYEIDIKDIQKILAGYNQIVQKAVYFGEDEHSKSKAFLKEAKSLGFELKTKVVKYQEGVRKCNFDIEIAMDCLMNVSHYDSFIFFSGNDDFTYLYEHLIKLGKQVIVIFGSNSLGKELHRVNGLFLLDFRIFAKKYYPKQVWRYGFNWVMKKIEKKSTILFSKKFLNLTGYRMELGRIDRNKDRINLGIK